MKIFKVGDKVILKESTLKECFSNNIPDVLLRSVPGTVSYCFTYGKKQFYEIRFGEYDKPAWSSISHGRLMKYEDI